MPRSHWKKYVGDGASRCSRRFCLKKVAVPLQILDLEHRRCSYRMSLEIADASPMHRRCYRRRRRCYLDHWERTAIIVKGIGDVLGRIADASPMHRRLLSGEYDFMVFSAQFFFSIRLLQLKNHSFDSKMAWLRNYSTLHLMFEELWVFLRIFLN